MSVNYAEYEMREIIEKKYCTVFEHIDSHEEIIRVPADRNIYSRKVTMKLELESTISQLRNNCSNKRI